MSKGIATLSPGAVAWALFEGTRVPFVILVTIYVFTPYFASVMIGDPVQGQAAVATIGKWGGWMVALTAPFVGALLDRLGPRKPFLATITAIMAISSTLLWWAAPDGSGISVRTVMVLGAINTILYAYGELAHNSLVQRAAPGKEHLASGLGLILGNGISTALLIFVLAAFVLPADPLFGLDKAMNEPDRIVGPMVGAAMLLGCLPLLALTPDAPRSRLGLVAAMRAGLADLRNVVAGARGHRDALTFLVARILYADGKVAILLFGGVYAAGVLGWRTRELLAYGVILSVFAVLGGFVGAWLDGRAGPRRALQIELSAVLVAQIAILGIRPDMLFYLPFDPASAPLWDGPIFRTAPELAYIGIGFVTAVSITAAFASSRTLLVRLVPPEAAGRFFGLYALSGNATYWLAPTLIEMFTRIIGTQQAGFYPVIALILLGLAGLSFVRGGGRLVPEPR